MLASLASRFAPAALRPALPRDCLDRHAAYLAASSGAVWPRSIGGCACARLSPCSALFGRPRLNPHSAPAGAPGFAPRGSARSALIRAALPRRAPARRALPRSFVAWSARGARPVARGASAPPLRPRRSALRRPAAPLRRSAWPAFVRGAAWLALRRAAAICAGAPQPRPCALVLAQLRAALARVKRSPRRGPRRASGFGGFAALAPPLAGRFYARRPLRGAAGFFARPRPARFWGCLWRLSVLLCAAFTAICYCLYFSRCSCVARHRQLSPAPCKAY